MSQKLTRDAYAELIAGNLEWLKRVAGTASTLERRNIEEILRDSVRAYYDVEAERVRLIEDNARLRGLIAKAESYSGCGGYDPESGCPWCDASMSYDAERRSHERDCPAFSAPGVVR